VVVCHVEQGHNLGTLSRESDITSLESLRIEEREDTDEFHYYLSSVACTF
jgi:hypothetical protein